MIKSESLDRERRKYKNISIYGLHSLKEERFESFKHSLLRGSILCINKLRNATQFFFFLELVFLYFFQFTGGMRFPAGHLPSPQATITIANYTHNSNAYR